jgi:WD40 repeat protein
MPINDRDLQKTCAAFSDDGKLFAYNTNKGKLLSIWNTADWSLVENKTLAKHATNIVFTPKTNVIVVGDKKGDVYAFDKFPVCVLGHSSMILDISFTSDEKYIGTCDSDEKVRISHYPNGKNILYYMMGHEAYVSGICIMNNLILSGSGDQTLRLWNVQDGYLQDKLSLHTPIQSLVRIEDIFAAQLYDSKEVHFIKIEENGSKQRLKDIKTITFKENVASLGAFSNQLWVIAGISVHEFTVDSRNEIIVENENPKRTLILNGLVKSFVCLENTNLMIFLHKKMIEKQIRTKICSNYSMPALNSSKRIKLHNNSIC